MPATAAKVESREKCCDLLLGICDVVVKELNGATVRVVPNCNRAVAGGGDAKLGRSVVALPSQAAGDGLVAGENTIISGTLERVEVGFTLLVVCVVA